MNAANRIGGKSVRWHGAPNRGTNQMGELGAHRTRKPEAVSVHGNSVLEEIRLK